MFPVKIDGGRAWGVRGANGGRDREEGPINAATSVAKPQPGHGRNFFVLKGLIMALTSVAHDQG
jgi:hypothetical protein